MKAWSGLIWLGLETVFIFGSVRTPGDSWSAYPSSASQELFSVTLDFEISFSVPKIKAVGSCKETSPVQQTA